MVHPTRKNTKSIKSYSPISTNENEPINTVYYMWFDIIKSKQAKISLSKTHNAPIDNQIKSLSRATNDQNRKPLKDLKILKGKQPYSKYTSTNINDPFECLWEIPRTPPSLNLPKIDYAEHEITDADISIDFTLSRENSPRDIELLPELPNTETKDSNIESTPTLPKATSLESVESQEKQLPTIKHEDLTILLSSFVCMKYGRRGKPHQRELRLTEDRATILWKVIILKALNLPVGSK